MAEAVEKKEINLTDNCKTVLRFMKENDNGDAGYLGVEIAEAVGCNPKGIHGVMNSLVKNGLVAKGSREGSFVSKDGKKGTKPYTTYYLTEDGRAFEIQA